MSSLERAVLLHSVGVRGFDGSIFGAALANVETFKLEYWTQGRNAGHPGH
jgi:hypothetical protein